MDETKGSAKGGIRSTEAVPFGSDQAPDTAQPSANAMNSGLLNPNPQPAEKIGEIDPTVTGFTEGGLLGDEESFTIVDPERRRAIIEALHAHAGILRGLIARREGEFNTNPSSLQYELQALKKGKLRVETLLGELDPDMKQAASS